MNDDLASTCFQLIETSLGWLSLSWQEGSVVRLVFDRNRPRDVLSTLPVAARVIKRPTRAMQAAEDSLRQFSEGIQVSLAGVPVHLGGRSPFERQVIQACRELDWGEVVSYSELADRAGRAGAARAVGTVMRKNRVPLLVPCHRVIAAGRRIGGYSAHDGVETKRMLLAREGVHLRG